MNIISKEFMVASHTVSRDGNPKGTWLTVLIEWYDTSTIQSVQGEFYWKQGELGSKHLLNKLIKENPGYARDYYRAPFCCGNAVEVELKKTYQEQQICWILEITIKGRPSLDEELDPSFKFPTTCTRTMSLDDTLDDLLSTKSPEDKAPEQELRHGETRLGLP